MVEHSNIRLLIGSIFLPNKNPKSRIFRLYTYPNGINNHRISSQEYPLPSLLTVGRVQCNLEALYPSQVQFGMISFVAFIIDRKRLKRTIF
jgi:hypothetical protein